MPKELYGVRADLPLAADSTRTGLCPGDRPDGPKPLANPERHDNSDQAQWSPRVRQSRSQAEVSPASLIHAAALDGCQRHASTRRCGRKS